MQQSLKLLQAATQELQQMVTQELSQNPVLELETPEISLEEAGLDKEGDDGFDEEFSQLSQLDEEWREYMTQARSKLPRGAEEDERRQFMFDSLVAPVTLSQHLIDQLGTETLDAREREVVEKLIGQLDERGYLSSPLREICQEEGIPIEELERAKVVVQGLDPSGVGAEDLRECLLIQLRALKKGDTLEYKIVAHHLEELAKRRFQDISRKLRVTMEQISEAAEVIGRLNPRPAQDFAQPGSNVYVSADVSVEWQDERYVVQLNNDSLPRLRISNTYKDLMSTTGTRDEVRSYIRERIRSGKFFIRSIDQRQQTIRRIAEEIVARQEAFLAEGPAHLKPMNMAQVADAIGVHETTVSRAVSGKYISTPQGVFEMRYFFTTGLQSESGESLSNTSIKTALQELVKGEPHTKPYSDEAIVKKLAEQGIKLARRTVAKYREELNILPSHLRKGF